ncbi:hypothetical protein METP2_02310 [Methanosarcinales archaeon]|nr:hypothetical protein METP2_02310 [Methanosarcinales archaeon]
MSMDEIKFKCINTQKLWESNIEDIKNLTIEGGELRLSSTYIYESGNEIINNDSFNMSDIAVDGCNIIFIIDKNSKSILSYEIGSGIINDMGALPVILESPSGIAIDKDSIYVADKGRLIALARSNLQIRWIISGSHDGSPINELIDITVAGDVIYALEKCREIDVERGIGKRILMINRAGNINFPPISPGNDPTDITVDKDGDIYVLGRNTLTNKNNLEIFRKKFLFERHNVPGIDNDKLLAFLRDHLNIDWLMGAEISGIDEKTILVSINGKYVKISFEENKDMALITTSDGAVHYLLVNEEDCNLNVYYIDTPETIDIAFSPKGLAVDSRKQIFVGEAAGDISKDQTIYKIIDQKNISPMWSYRGASGRLITDSKNNLYVIDGTGKKLVYLKYSKINRPDKSGLFSGHYISKPINSASLKTRWHRFLLEGRFEEGTQVDFSYYISDNINTNIGDLDENEWHKGLPGSSSIQGTYRRDALFLKDNEGQYLWFKISLTGNETRSPVLNSIRLFFPRFSYLDNLPAIYQEDAASREFLERFLSIFESIFYEIDFKVEHLGRFFDSLGAPPEFLSWLGYWLSITWDENFSEKMRRLYIRRAILLYKKRGTKEGLEEAIALFLYTKKHPEESLEDIIANFKQEKPYIVENFNARRIPEDKKCMPCLKVKDLYFPPFDAKTTTDVLFGNDLFSFFVLLPDANMDEDTINTVKRIIEEQKPAHTCYCLKMLEPWFYLDMHTYLDINTRLTYPILVMDRTSVLGRDTVLYDAEQSGQVRVHSRIGVDTKLT